MTKARILSLIEDGEGLRIEFKECKQKLPKNVYETVCAFLNRNGGEILLGVRDDGEIIGVDKDKVDTIKKEFVTTVNNSSKISPSFNLSIQQVTVDDKEVLYILVPESSQVHRCNGKFFDRNQDGDFNVSEKNTHLSGLFMNKQLFHTENKIFPQFTMSDLRPDIFEKARKLAAFQNREHPWQNMSDMEIVKSAKLYGKDMMTNKEGFTLACILLFGADSAILDAIPFHKTDLILRKVNLDRYDDRDDVRTNLFDTYSHIMAFGQKHLPDPFYLEDTPQGPQRTSIRDKIVREIASNILIHREYTNAFPAKVIIERKRIYSENANRPHDHGLIDLNNFSPFPKNPNIARVFRETGMADELGSGVRNLLKYVEIYSKGRPQLFDEDVFKLIVPIPDFTYGSVEPVSEPVSEPVKLNASEKEMLIEMRNNPEITKKELEKTIGKSRATITRYINHLKEIGYLERNGSDKSGYWVVILQGKGNN